MFSNSMVESVNKTLKYQYLFIKSLSNFGQVEKYLQIMIEDFNNRPAGIHFGLSPLQVLEGSTPDKFFQKIEIVRARKNRIIENQKYE